MICFAMHRRYLSVVALVSLVLYLVMTAKNSCPANDIYIEREIEKNVAGEKTAQRAVFSFLPIFSLQMAGWNHGFV